MNLPGVYDTFLRRWDNYQTVWIISDTHFGDEELAAGMPDRLYKEHLVQLINSKVGRKDVLIHLGDVGDVEFAKQLRGYKVLIMGNHDAGRTNYERRIVSKKFPMKEFQKTEALEEMKKLYPNCRYFVEESWEFRAPFNCWVIYADNMLFDEVYEGPLMIAEKLLLSHEPIQVPWAFNIHGHDHVGKHLHKGGMNVCVDADGMGYCPINLNQALKNGLLSKVESIHRDTINKATDRKRKRGGKKIGQR